MERGLAPTLNEVLDSELRKAVKGAQVLNVYLWGSRVYGTASSTSDWDYNGELHCNLSLKQFFPFFAVVDSCFWVIILTLELLCL